MSSVNLATESLRFDASTGISDDEVAITGSPNTVTEIHFDVRVAYLQTPLLGTLLSLRVPVQLKEESTELFVLGQVATLETKNRWHEDLSLKNFLKIRGKIPHLTQIGDITLGKLQIIGAYRIENGSDFKKLTLPVPPGSGITIGRVSGDIIRRIMQGDFGYGYLGMFYGTSNVPAPVYVRHFGDFKDKGSGEAYMGGVFGPSGSGKSVIAASLIALWAVNPLMGILILDPASEFSGNLFARGTQFHFDFHKILTHFSKGRFDSARDVINLDQLQLEGCDIFVRVLHEKGFFTKIGLSSKKAEESIEHVAGMLEGLVDTKEWKSTMSWDEINSLNVVDPTSKNQADKKSEITFRELFLRSAASSYAARGRADYIAEYNNQWDIHADALEKIWEQTVVFFKDFDGAGKKRIRLLELIEGALSKGEIRILDLNPEKVNMSQQFKVYLMDFVFKKLRHLSHYYYSKNKTGNCLIVLDEAGRFIPQAAENDDKVKSLSKTLSDSVKELRKMRCGFMFITQTISEIQKDIFRNLHYRVYGVGLAVGADAEHMRAKEGDSAFDVYKTLPDPRLSGTYSFMVAGILLALGSTGKPMIIEGFSSGEHLIEENQGLI